MSCRIRIVPVTILVLILCSPLISANFIFSDDVSSFISNVTRTGAWDAFQKLAGCHHGQTVDGLAKLKQYFQRFGYISEDLAANFTDDFDNMLESAIKMYQQNFNLNVTGELDSLTLRQIGTPRCGNLDIINGSTTMNGGGFNRTNPSRHLHAVARYSLFPGSPRWEKSDLTYAFLPQNQLTEEVKTVFKRAFDRWATVIPLTFTRSESFIRADIAIGFYVGDHGDGEAFDGVLGTLAHAFSPPSGHFHLDGDENWVVNLDQTNLMSSISAVDLESVAVHEIGHLLGLGHSSTANAIMYPSITTGTRKVELASDDIEGIQFLYGPNPNYNGSSPSTPWSHQNDTTTTSESSVAYRRTVVWGLSVLLLAVGFMALIL